MSRRFINPFGDLLLPNQGFNPPVIKNRISNSDGSNPVIKRGSDFSINDYLMLDPDAWEALYNDIMGINSERQAMQDQRELAELQHGYDMEKLDKEAYYNSFPYQAEQAAAAGLNPAAVLSGASSVSGGAASMPSAPGSRATGVNPIDTINNSVDTLVGGLSSMAEIRNKDSQTRLNNIEAGFKPLEKQASLKLWESQADKFIAETNYTNEDKAFLMDQHEFFRITSESQRELLQQQVNEAVEQVNLLRVQVTNAEHETAVIDANKELIEQQRSTLAEQEDLLRKQGVTEEKLASLYESQTELNDQDKLLKVVEYRAAQMLGNLPLSMDGRQRIAVLLTSSNPEDNEKGQKLLDELLSISMQEYDQAVQSQWQNIGYNFVMDLLEGLGGSAQFLPFMFSGHGRTKTVRGYGR